MNRSKNILIVIFTILTIFFRFEGNTQEVKKIELNTYLMQSTFMLKGEGSKGKPLWIRNDDKEVNVAVMYIDNIPPEVEISLLPIDFLADEKDLITIGIHPGDDILCMGYPFEKGWGEDFFQ